MGISQVSHAELAVGDLEVAVGLHVDVLGMKELGRSDGSVRLTAGVDERCDLVLTSGGTGVRRFALRVDSRDDLEYYGKRLANAGVEHSTRSDEDPGVSQSLQFRTPTGHVMELSLLTDAEGPQYIHPARAPIAAGSGHWTSTTSRSRRRTRNRWSSSWSTSWTSRSPTSSLPHPA